MKIEKIVSKGTVYAIAVATGTSAAGNKYANVLVSNKELLQVRSNYSIYLDPSDEILMKQIGNPNLVYSEDGARKVTLLQKPMELQKKYTLACVTHQPYQVDSKVIRRTYITVPEDESVEGAAEAALQRGYDRATGFFRDPEGLYEDYRRFVLFDLSREELEELLNNSQDLPE